MSLTIQKASLWKRISAWLFDIILAATLVVGISFAASSIFGYSGYITELQTRYAAYEQEYGVDFNISQEDYNALTEAEKAKFEEASVALSNDEDVMKLSAAIFYMTLAILSLSCFFGILIWYFLMPLLFGNGQTLGKKIFGVAVMRTNGLKATQTVLFIRAMVGMFAIETMFPILMVVMIYFGLLGGVGTITILLLFGLQLFVLISSQTNSAIHDLLCDTVVVDLATQIIFETEEDLNAYNQQNVLNSRN